ncbi:RraA family protein [Paraburkholderia sp. BL25I1N1]|uniref:RraA family protein n=1 Tax=Paraburkholderia sp. BL25I1N1 TaxID=1938804 RepID=UPI000D06A9AA|nr:RraA family protein [Paraburkholderia sp. BL25I1N1]PRY05949.1 regulator of RNase E activity RraA [Paraburkholderia sp. BL25I1N1]
MSLPGFRINPAPNVAPEGVIDRLKNVVTPHLSDNMGRLVGAVGLTRFNKTGKLVGTAFTVKTRPGDNLIIYKALMMMQSGHVLVVDGGGEQHNALVGELVKLHAEQHGCVGFVIDGSIRDVAAFEAFPCYARSISHRGPYKDGPGELNVPVSIGGQVVNAGDLVVGDEDGVVFFPQDSAEELLALASKHAEKERGIQDEIATGRREQQWIEKLLHDKIVT